jgi:hypothetical protein
MKILKKILLFTSIITSIIVIFFITFLWNNSAAKAFSISEIEFIGEARLPQKATFKNVETGGFSGITYDAEKDLYYVISDDRGEKAPARFYTLKIDLSKGKLENGDVFPVDVTTILNQNNQTFPPGETDTEGIALTNRNTVFISSEGDVRQLINPFIKEFALTSGKFIRELPIPRKFLPDPKGQQGIRNNLAFESLTITPDNQHLFTATENALIQDGLAAQPNVGSPCRILQYNLRTYQPEKEFLYTTEPVAEMFNFRRIFASGIPDLLALDNHGHFLSIERSFTGLAFAVSLFEVSLAGADEIHNIPNLLAVDIDKIQPVQKKLLLDLRTLDVLLDNIEGLTLGPKLPDGQRSLILISDNNYNPLQRNQILAFKIKIESPIIRFLRRLIPRQGKYKSI